MAAFTFQPQPSLLSSVLNDLRSHGWDEEQADSAAGVWWSMVGGDETATATVTATGSSEQGPSGQPSEAATTSFSAAGIITDAFSSPTIPLSVVSATQASVPTARSSAAATSQPLASSFVLFSSPFATTDASATLEKSSLVSASVLTTETGRDTFVTSASTSVQSTSQTASFSTSADLSSLSGPGASTPMSTLIKVASFSTALSSEVTSAPTETETGSSSISSFQSESPSAYSSPASATLPGSSHEDESSSFSSVSGSFRLSSSTTSSQSPSSSYTAIASSRTSSHPSSASPAVAAAANDPDSSSSSGMSSLKVGAIVGGTLGAVTLLALLALLFFLRRRSRNRKYSTVGPDEHSRFAAVGPISSYHPDSPSRPPEMAQLQREYGGGEGMMRSGYSGLAAQRPEQGGGDPFSDAEAAAYDEEDEEREELNDRRSTGRGVGYGQVPAGDEEHDLGLLRAAEGYRRPNPLPRLDTRAIPVAAGHKASLPIVGVVPPTPTPPASSVGISSPATSSIPSTAAARVSSGSEPKTESWKNPFAQDGDESSDGEHAARASAETDRQWLGRRRLDGSPFFGARMPHT
ncbi:hypothetical protein JCM11641_005043 [Rhodosporidiobolus odoratus]